jgi:hypothetical protein
LYGGAQYLSVLLLNQLHVTYLVPKTSEVAPRFLENIRAPDHNHHHHRQPLRQSAEKVGADGTGVISK